MLLTVTAIVFTVTVTISFILARIFANRMYRPIDTLVKSMNDVTEGKLDIKIDIHKHDSDEMKLVSSVFNWMINRIHTVSYTHLVLRIWLTSMCRRTRII